MNKPKPSHPETLPDEELLQQIEAAISNAPSHRSLNGSLSDFCAHLAASVPLADEAFQEQLEMRLLARYRAKHHLHKEKRQMKILRTMTRRLWTQQPRMAMAISLVAVLGVAFLAFSLHIARFGGQGPRVASAQEVLARVSEAHAQMQDGEGVRHTITENYLTYQDEETGEMVHDNYSEEDYFNLGTGYYRIMYTDLDTGQLLYIESFDGERYYWYEAESNVVSYYAYEEGFEVVSPVRNMQEERARAQEWFEQLKNDPNAEYLGPEESNGHTVHVLRSVENEGVMLSPLQEEGESGDTPEGDWIVTITEKFDVDTYLLVESEYVETVGGEEMSHTLRRIVTDELLPADTEVFYDLSDLEGASFEEDHSLDDMDLENMDVFPPEDECITFEEAVQQTSLPLVSPSYVPAAMTRSCVLFFAPEMEEVPLSVTLFYGSDKGADSDWLAVTETALSDDMVESSAPEDVEAELPEGQDWTTEELEINGTTVTLEIFAEDTGIVAYYTTDDFVISIDSSLPREEIIKVLEGLLAQ